ncbi:3'-5' exonuclease, partial [Klebsiella pneumoniae]|uniref:3'-5' exonuclease n=1 Tax=Klebsiella pneumoniae TaxID=573 RepID=UPI00351D1565
MQRYCGCSSRTKRGNNMATVFLDTETTGLDDHAELVEIAVVNEDGCVLFESFCRPTVPVDPGAQAVHGIGDDVLA